MSLQAKIEAVIYASEEPVTLQQLAGLLGEEAAAELDHLASQQAALAFEEAAEGEPATGNSDETDDGAADKQEMPGDAATLPEAEHSGGTNVGSDVQHGTGAATTDQPTREEDTLPVQATVSAVMENAPDPVQGEAERRHQRERDRAVRDHIRRAVDALTREYAEGDRGIEIREVASGFRMATKPEYHDSVRGFVKSLKPALKLTLPALETLAVVAYKQPVTAAEISEIRGVDSAGVLGGLLARKLIATAGRKQVIGRPMLYKTTRDFLLRFGLKDVTELPSMDEFERMAGELVEQDDLPMDGTGTLIEQANVRGDAEHIRQITEDAISAGESEAEVDDLDESDDALQAEAAALTSDEQATTEATAATAAGGNNGRNDEPAAATPLHTTQTSEPAGEQDREPAAAGPTGAGAEEGGHGGEG